MESPFILYQVQCPDVITKDSMRSFAILAQRTSDHSQATALFDHPTQPALVNEGGLDFQTTHFSVGSVTKLNFICSHHML